MNICTLIQFIQQLSTVSKMETSRWKTSFKECHWEPWMSVSQTIYKDEIFYIFFLLTHFAGGCSRVWHQLEQQMYDLGTGRSPFFLGPQVSPQWLEDTKGLLNTEGPCLLCISAQPLWCAFSWISESLTYPTLPSAETTRAKSAKAETKTLRKGMRSSTALVFQQKTTIITQFTALNMMEKFQKGWQASREGK